MMKKIGWLLVLIAIAIFILGSMSGNVSDQLAITSILVGILGILIAMVSGRRN